MARVSIARTEMIVITTETIAMIGGVGMATATETGNMEVVLH